MREVRFGIDEPALVFVYLGYYCSIFCDNEKWWYNITTEEQAIDMGEELGIEMGVGDVVEYLIGRINDINLRNFAILN